MAEPRLPYSGSLWDYQPPAEEEPAEDLRPFSDMDRRELVSWLYRWGHTWAHRFVDIYGMETVTEVLDLMMESPDSERVNKVKPPYLINAVRAHVEEGQAQTDAQPEPLGEIVPFERWSQGRSA